jgi:hypothetical protein
MGAWTCANVSGWEMLAYDPRQREGTALSWRALRAALIT